MSEINLLTTEEKLEQKIDLYTKVSNVILVILLLVVGGLGYYFNTLTNPLIEEKNDLDSKISTLKKEITEFSKEESELRDVKLRYDAANKFLNEKILYEKVMREIYERNVSGGVTIKTITINTDKDLVSVRVSSDSTSFKRFVDNLKSPQVSENNIKNIFSNSGVPEDVNEVSKEYVVTVKYNKGDLDVKEGGFYNLFKIFYFPSNIFNFDYYNLFCSNNALFEFKIRIRFISRK